MLIVTDAGVTAMEVRTEALTVSVALLLVMPDRLADILVVPATRPEVQPTDGAAATVALLLCHVTDAVMF